MLNLIKRQNEELKISRAEFFRFIKSHNNPQDVGQRLQLLVALTNNGKNVQHFEEDVSNNLELFVIVLYLHWYNNLNMFKEKNPI